jgi:UDP-glucose 4-epimerase
MNTCLLTGATGLIGTEFLGLMESRGWMVHALSRRKPSLDSDAVRFIECDLSREWPVSRLPAKVDAVVHLAQSKNFRRFPEFSQDIFDVNTAITVRSLHYARQSGAGTFVLASSGGIYGHGMEGFKEDEPVFPSSDLGFYLSTKLCAEVLAESFTPYLNVIILRFFFVYGPGQRSSMLVPRLMARIRDGEPVTLHGRDGIKINPIFVSDAARAVSSSLDLETSHKINIGGPEILTMRTIGEQIGALVGREPNFEIEQDVPPKDLIGDISKMCRVFREPEVRFSEGIAKMAE